MAEQQGRILLIEPDAERAEAMIDRLRTWFPDLEVELAIGDRDAAAWRARNKGLVCSHEGACLLIDLAMAAEDKTREVLLDIATLRGEVRNIEKGQALMAKKVEELDHAIDGNGGKGIKHWVDTMIVALYGDPSDIEDKPGLVSTQRDIAKDVKRIMGWGSAVSLLIIGALVAIWVGQTFGGQ